MPHRVIRSIGVGTRKRDHGDSACMPKSEDRRICLLELFPPGQGMAQRRAIQVRIDGELVWREFEIVRTFESTEKATAYASEHSIDDVAL